MPIKNYSDGSLESMLLDRLNYFQSEVDKTKFMLDYVRSENSPKEKTKKEKIKLPQKEVKKNKSKQKVIKKKSTHGNTRLTFETAALMKYIAKLSPKGVTSRDILKFFFPNVSPKDKTFLRKKLSVILSTQKGKGKLITIADPGGNGLLYAIADKK